MQPRRSDTASRIISASSDALYGAFTSSGSLMQWLPPSGMSGRALEYDFRKGGRYKIELRFEGHAQEGSGKTTGNSDVTSGEFLELIPGRRIKQSVEFESNDAAFTGTMTMTWEFDKADRGTLVTVTADNVPPGISKDDHAAGLTSSLDNLARYAADHS